MIIACPKCFTRYNVPEASLGSAGRMVKCKNCGHKWHQAPKEPAAQQPEQPQPQQPQQPQAQQPQAHQPQAPQAQTPHPPTEHAPVAPQPQQAEQTAPAGGVPALRTPDGRKILPLWVGMAMGAAATLVVIGLGVLLKDPLTNAMPAMAGIFSSEDPTSRLEASQTDTRGLVVENVQRDILEEGGFTTYIISGNVTNTNMSRTSVPNLEVSLLDERGNLIDQWQVQPKTAQLAPGESTSWICYFYNPPLAKVSEYSINFVN